MVNRFYNPDEQFADATGTPYAGGFLYFYVSGTSTPLTTYSDSLLASPNTNPIVLDSAGRCGSVFLQTLPYKVILKDVNGNLIWTQDPVATSDYTGVAQFAPNAGNPNGLVAGTAGSGSIPASVIWDITNNILYVCTTTGTSTTAVWTAVNSASAAAIVPPPQGYLTLTSATPIIPTDVTAATAVYYTPYVGNTVPIYNGSSFTPTTFAELTLALVASHAASTLYDVFIFNNSGAVTVVTGPAWTASGAGAGARGAGAGTTQLQRINGILVNAVLMTGRNGSTTYSIGANLATYVGSLFIDSAAGQTTCHRTYGQSRKWGVWNAYNRVPIFLKAGDPTASWTYATNTIRSSNNAAANSLTIFSGLAEQVYDLRFVQKLTPATSNLTGITATVTESNGIGYNSVVAMSGKTGNVSFGISMSGATFTLNSSAMDGKAEFLAPPALGINTISALEVTASATNGTATYNGTEASMLLSALWMG